MIPKTPKTGITATLCVKHMDTGKTHITKAFTTTLQNFYTQVRPGQVLSGTADDIEDTLMDILMTKVQYKLNLTSRPIILTALKPCQQLTTVLLYVKTWTGFPRIIKSH